jgi:hypothetical protein
MTSPLRRKRPTTARGRSTPATTAAKLAAAGLLLAGGLARAQQLPPLPPPAAPPVNTRPAPPPPLPAAPAAPAPAVKKITYHKAIFPAPSASQPASDIRLTQYGAGGRGTSAVGADQADYLFQLVPASRERLFGDGGTLKSEASLDEQIRQEGREKTPPERTVFPDEKPVTGTRYTDHVFAPQVCLTEPNYVNYKRLYFQDLNTERYGWELGPIQPLVSTGLFFKDLAVLPYRWASRPFDCVDSSAGYCLPGDPVPYLCYPPNLSVTGAVGEAAAVIAVLAIFP